MKKAVMGGVFVIAVIFWLTGITPSCTHETPNPDQFDTICFERDVFPVIRNACATTDCHAGTGEAMDLTTYENIRKEVTPGSASESELYQAIIATLNEPMPPDNALPEADRIRIRIWIEQGAEPTTCTPEPVAKINPEGGKR